MRLSWGAVVVAVSFGAGAWVRGSEWPVTGIYRIGYGIGRLAGAREAAAAARRGVGIPPLA